MNKRNVMVKYQVFLSSVSMELHEERTALIKSMLSMDRFFPIAMEYFTAESDTVHSLYEYLKVCDIYVLILKHETGSFIGSEGADSLTSLMEKNLRLKELVEEHCQKHNIQSKQLTFTQVEYLIAQALELEIMVFVYKETSYDNIGNLMNSIGIKDNHSAVGWITCTELVASVCNSLSRCSLPEDKGWYKISESDLHNTFKGQGIKDIAYNGRGFYTNLESHLEDANELLLIYTTGKGFIHTNQELLASFVAKGGVIKLITAMPYSDTLKDVQRIEIAKLGSRSDINLEFLDVINNLHSIWGLAKAKNTSLSVNIGKIMIASVGTMFRSSILLCVMPQKVWGWLALTLPPAKSSDMISIELEDFIPSDNNCPKGLLASCMEHFHFVWDLAEESDLVAEISEHTSPDSISTKLVPFLYWQKKSKEAKKEQKKHQHNSKVLIEIAAQHPLLEGQYPATEFKARLDYGYRLYTDLVSQNIPVDIYVPGSIHLEADIYTPDEYEIPECSLSEAGINYLVSKGIPSEILHGDDWNDLEISGRNWKGVYNTADECYVSAYQYNKKENDYCKLLCVCSPNQVLRKTLFYLENNVVPYIYSAPVDKMFHNIVNEVFEQIPTILNYDHNWQELSSAHAFRTRSERMPYFSAESDSI